MQSINWKFIVGAPAWLSLGQYVTLDKKFNSLLFKQEAVATPVISKFSSLSQCLEEAFIRNAIITLCSNYIIIICINNNNAIINNNYVRIQDLILLLKISMGTRKNFFEIY